MPPLMDAPPDNKVAPHLQLADQQRISTSSGFWKGTLLLASLLAIVYSLLMISTISSTTNNWELQVSIVSLIWIAIYFGCTYFLFKTAYLLTSSYVAMLVLFHLGITVPDAFGLLGQSVWPRGADSKWIELSGWCTVLSLGSLGLGFSVGLKRREFGIHRTLKAGPDGDTVLAGLYSDGLGLLVACAIFLGLALASFGNLLNYTRVDFFRGVGDTRGLGGILMVLPGALTALLIGSTTPAQRRFAAIVATLGFITVLMSGYRGYALFPLLVGATLWVKTGRTIPKLLVVGILGLVLLAISAVGVLREGRAYKDINFATLVNSAQQANLQDTLLLGGTGGVLAEVLRLVPAHDSYRYGQSYWLALELSIPNVLPHTREDPRAKSREAAHDVDAINNMPPADWITYRIAPDLFDVGEGVGFTGIGEPYINFGYPGVITFFVGLGFCFARMDSAVLQQRPLLLVFCCAMLWPLISTVRQDIGNFIKPAVFVFVIVCAWRGITKLFRAA
jgi:O-antigen polysaccharide polymerase Wzy